MMMNEMMKEGLMIEEKLSSFIGMLTSEGLCLRGKYNEQLHYKPYHTVLSISLSHSHVKTIPSCLCCYIV